MDTLKNSLKEKLLESKHLQNDLEALPRCSDVLAQNKAIDRWHNAWVKAAFQEKLESFASNKPFFNCRPKLTILHSSSDNGLQKRIQREARNEVCKKRDFLCLLPAEMQKFEQLLCGNSISSGPPSLPSSPAGQTGHMMRRSSITELMDVPAPLDQMISLDGYQKTLTEFSQFLKDERALNGYLVSDSLWVMRWFTTKLFTRLVKPENDGLVQVSSIMEYVFKKLQLYQLRLELMKYDTDGSGYFTKENLVKHLHRHFREEKTQNAMVKFYINTIVSEIFFLLDPQRKGKIKLVELLGSRLHPQLRPECWDGQLYTRFSKKLSAYKEMIGNNRRTTAVPLHIFCDKFPEISQLIWKSDERIQEKRVRFLQSVVQRLIHLHETSSSDKENNNNLEVCFSTFIDITHAWENLGSCYSSIGFFFKALDTDDKGYLDESDLQRHYRSIEEILKLQTRRRSYNYSPSRCGSKNWVTPSFLYIQAHIKNFLAREAISRITPENLYKTRDGYTVIAYLINVETSLNNTLKNTH